MNPELALSYLASLNESRIKPGFERIQEVLKRLGDPHYHYPHMLIAGTNGKGSVSSMVCSGLLAAGITPGCFTSPHLQRFNERIAIGDRFIDDHELAALVRDVRDTGVDLTYFEFATAMALLQFSRQEVDVAVLEVGLGGKWDATNVTDPFLSVITNVELDHEKWLGSTVEDVASHKAPVMRPVKPVVVGPVSPRVRDVLSRYAESIHAQPAFFGTDFNAAWEHSGGSAGRTLQFTGRTWSMNHVDPGLPGRYQLENAACALAVLETMAASGWAIAPGKSVRGLGKTIWPGRFQRFEGKPPILVDAAHNPAAVQAVVDSLEETGSVVWLVSALEDKDLKTMADVMASKGNRFILAPLDHPRASSMDQMLERLPEGTVARSAKSVRHGLELARDWAGENSTVVVAGSVFLAGKVLEILEVQDPGARSQPFDKAQDPEPVEGEPGEDQEP